MSSGSDLPLGWIEAALPEVAEVNPSNPKLLPADDVPVSFIPMSAVDTLSGRLDPSDVRPWSQVKKGYTRFQDGDVLLAKITPCMENGKAAVARGLSRGVGAGSTEFHVLRPTDALRAELLLHYVLQEEFRRSARAHMTGTAGQLRVPSRFLDEKTLPLPPLPEQHRIVSALESYFTRLDAAVETLQRVQRNLKRYRASVLKAAIEGRLVPTEAELARAEGRSYEPASVLLTRILAERRRRWEEAELAKMTAKGKAPKDDKWKAKYVEPVAPDTSELPELPEGWCWATLDLLAAVKGGITKGQKPRSGENYREVPYLRVANVQRGFLDLQQMKTIQAPDAVIDELRLERGDVLFNEGGDRDKLGRGWIWKGEIAECIHQNHVFRARMHTDDMQPELLSWYGNTAGQQYFFEEGKHTTNLASINLTKLRALPVPVPPRAEQARIRAAVERQISVVDDALGSISLEVTRLARLRQSILKWAFEGRLVDQDPTDEPASVLLERIRAEREASGDKPSRRAARQRKGLRRGGA